MKSSPSEHCLENCKPYEEKLKTNKIKIVNLIHVKLLRMKQKYDSICVKR